jgi:acyl phosphate:glycerol-3-phosphate acyltransferase
MNEGLLLALGLVLASYIVGATPTSYWVGKGIHGIDLRTRGSGNLGATNVFRVLGAWWAAPVMAVDVAKGWLPVAFFPLLLAGDSASASATAAAGMSADAWALVFGASAIVGHVFSFWVGFRGGKGVATSAGVFLGLAPWAVLVALGLWALVVALTRYVSLASILAALALPPLVMALPHRGGTALPVFAVALAAFVIWAHRSNIQRLRRGEERRMGRGGAA